jgi:hypothetical protein
MASQQGQQASQGEQQAQGRLSDSQAAAFQSLMSAFGKSLGGQ